LDRHHPENMNSVSTFIIKFIVGLLGRFKSFLNAKWSILSNAKYKRWCILIPIDRRKYYALTVVVSERRWTLSDMVIRSKIFRAIRWRRRALIKHFGTSEIEKHIEFYTTILLGSISRNFIYNQTRRGALRLGNEMIYTRDIRWILRAPVRSAQKIISELKPILRSVAKFLREVASRKEQSALQKIGRVYGDLKAHIEWLRTIALTIESYLDTPPPTP